MSHILTIHPPNTHRLQNGKQQKRHPTTRIVIKQLEDIQTTL